jgi:hypothetical protein
VGDVFTLTPVCFAVVVLVGSGLVNLPSGTLSLHAVPVLTPRLGGLGFLLIISFVPR